jgi:hypothetical protein
MRYPPNDQTQNQCDENGDTAGDDGREEAAKHGVDFTNITNISHLIARVWHRIKS